MVPMLLPVTFDRELSQTPFPPPPYTKKKRDLQCDAAFLRSPRDQYGKTSEREWSRSPAFVPVIRNPAIHHRLPRLLGVF